MGNMLTRLLATAALALGLLFAVAPAAAEAAVVAQQPTDGLIQTIQYYGQPGYYGPRGYYRPRGYYARPRVYRHPGFYGRPRYYGGPRFYGPRRGYYGPRSYYR
jgi:hypothetical protein